MIKRFTYKNVNKSIIVEKCSLIFQLKTNSEIKNHKVMRIIQWLKLYIKIIYYLLNSYKYDLKYTLKSYK